MRLSAKVIGFFFSFPTTRIIGRSQDDLPRRLLFLRHSALFSIYQQYKDKKYVIKGFKKSIRTLYHLFLFRLSGNLGAF